MIIDAAVSNVDYQSDTAAFEDIVVSQGGTRVTAARAQATGLDFKSSRWTFEGHVVMTLGPGGTVRSDRAIVEIRDNRLARATATGSPVRFEQQRSGPRGALHGHAAQMVFDGERDTVSLSGDATLSDGRNEITGPLLVYGLRDEKLMAVSPGRGRGVRITIPQPAPAGAAKPTTR